MSIDEANALLTGSGGPPSFSWDKKPVGTVVKGVITGLEVGQVRKYMTGEPMYFDGAGKPTTTVTGSPIRQIIATLRQDDGEETRVFFKPAMKAAVLDAVRAAGVERLDEGGTLAIKFTGEEQVEGLNPRKLFKAQYTPPVAGINLEDPF